MNEIIQSKKNETTKEENEDQLYLNASKLEKLLTNNLQSETEYHNFTENEPNLNQKERIRHPFIIRINNQQQDQNLGDQSPSLQNFPSMQQVSQKLVSRKIALDMNREENNNSIYQDPLKGGKTTESFINNQSEYQDKTECNQNILYDIIAESSKDQSQSFQSDYFQKSNLSAIKKQKSITLHKFNILQANQIEYKKKQNFTIDDTLNGQKNRTKLDYSLAISGTTHELKYFKKRNNLIYMDYKTQKNIWKTKWFQITSLISKMKKIAHNSSLFFRPNELSALQIKLINDVSSNQVALKFSSFSKQKFGSLLSYQNFQHFISFKNYRKFVKLILKYFGCFIEMYQLIKKVVKNYGIKLLNLLPLFHDFSFLYILWQLVICLSSSLLFIYIPFEYSFQIERSQFFDFYFRYYCSIIFGLDIFIKFITISSEQGTFTDQHIQVFSNYFKGSFFVDLISILSLNNNFFGFQLTQFLFFLRIFSSFRILEIIREQFLLKMKMFGIISLLYLLGQVIYFGHLFTCLWNYIGLLQLQDNQGWMVFYKFQNESIANRYVQIYYYATITMTTIGYGDFTAQTHLEKILMIFIAFFSCGIFGYTINSIGNILYDFKQRKDLYLQELAKVNKYFKQNNVELGLQCRARKYIQYLYSDQNNDNISSIKSLSNLSEYLQKEIQTDVYIKKLKKIKIFQEIFTDEILVELSLQMKESFYCHDQKISQSEEENEQFLYFVNNGIILEFCQYQQNTIIKEIHEYSQGQYFGLLAFLYGDNRRKVQYKSIGVSSILKISYSSFVSVLKQHNLAYEKFCFVRDEVKFSNKLMKINFYCNSCQQQNHVIEECPYLFYEGKKQIILRNYFRQQDNKSKNFRRQSTTKSYNALLNLNQISSQADRYYISNMEYFSMWDLSDESGLGSDEEFQDQAQINSSKKVIERQKSNQEASTDKNNTQGNKIDSFLQIEQYKELSIQSLSEKQIITQDKEKSHNSQKRLSTDLIQVPTEFQGRYINLIKKIDSLFRSQNHNYNSCSNQNCAQCKKQSELIYNLIEKNASKNERTSKLSNIFKNMNMENKPKKNSIFCNIDRNETENVSFTKQLSLNYRKIQKETGSIDIRQKISDIEKMLQKNSFKQSLSNQQTDQQLFSYDFDQPNYFIIYYPHSNIENIVKQINIIMSNRNLQQQMN